MGGVLDFSPKAETVTLPSPSTSAEDEARKERLATVERNRRGRAGMVNTSERGVLTPVSTATKSLLGE